MKTSGKRNLALGLAEGGKTEKFKGWNRRLGVDREMKDEGISPRTAWKPTGFDLLLTHNIKQFASV